MKEKIAEIVKEAVNYIQPCHSCIEYPCKEMDCRLCLSLARIGCPFKVNSAGCIARSESWKPKGGK